MSGYRNQERVDGDLSRVGLDVFREQRINVLRRSPAQQLVQILRDGPVGKRGDQCSAANFFAPKRIKLCTAASVRNTAIAHCANLNASQLQDASDLGIATDEEIKQLTDWKKISGAADAC